MWMHAGEYRPKPEPPSPERLNAMTKQCRNQGGDGCNCDDECKVDKALRDACSFSYVASSQNPTLTWSELKDSFQRHHESVQTVCQHECLREELNRHGIITEQDENGTWTIRPDHGFVYHPYPANQTKEERT